MGLRKLDRVDNLFGTDLKCKITCSNEEIECKVLDFNSLGFRLSLDEESFAKITRLQIQFASIIYGRFVLGSLTHPTILRAQKDELTIVLAPTQKSNVQQIERSQRSDIPTLLEPTLVGEDPVRLKEKLILRVENISVSGFRAKCSLSNRHLFAGQKLANFSMLLPGLSLISCHFRISTIQMDGDFLVLRCEFENMSQENQKLIRSFLLLCMFTEKPDERKSDSQAIGPTKVSSLLRVRRIDNLREMKEVLDLRFSAYKGANKLLENASVEDMADEFDKNSIILGSFIGSKLVGTIRIVFSKDGSKFPFEKYFDFPQSLDRDACVEISKLAIDPQFQGSDVLFRLFQSFSLEFIPKREYGLLMATDSLAKNYVMIGAKKLSGSVPHPVLKDESLRLYMLQTSHLKVGKMSALAWLFFAREAIDFMSKFGFTKKTRFPLGKLFRAPFELISKILRKVLRKKKKTN